MSDPTAWTNPTPASQEAPAAETTVEAAPTQEEKPVPTQTLKLGEVVRYSWSDNHGEHTSVGLVVEVADDPPTARVAWLERLSGPIASELFNTEDH